MYAGKCDHCGKYEQTPDGTTLPAGWLMVTRQGWRLTTEPPEKHFCSTPCLVAAHWPAEAPRPTTAAPAIHHPLPAGGPCANGPDCWQCDMEKARSGDGSSGTGSIRGRS